MLAPASTILIGLTDFPNPIIRATVNHIKNARIRHQIATAVREPNPRFEKASCPFFANEWY